MDKRREMTSLVIMLLPGRPLLPCGDGPYVGQDPGEDRGEGAEDALEEGGQEDPAEVGPGVSH